MSSLNQNAARGAVPDGSRSGADALASVADGIRRKTLQAEANRGWGKPEVFPSGMLTIRNIPAGLRRECKSREEREHVVCCGPHSPLYSVLSPQATHPPADTGGAFLASLPFLIPPRPGKPPAQPCVRHNRSGKGGGCRRLAKRRNLRHLRGIKSDLFFNFILFRTLRGRSGAPPPLTIPLQKRLKCVLAGLASPARPVRLVPLGFP